MTQEPTFLVLGMGNRHRGDDAVGLEVARRLKGMVSDHCSVIESDGDPLGVLDRWDGVALAIVIDAVSSGVIPGTIHKFDVTDRPLPASLSAASTHVFGLRELIELGRAVGKLPRRLTVLGIEGRNYSIGSRMSPECLAVIAPTVEEVLEEIECMSTL